MTRGRVVVLATALVALVATSAALAAGPGVSTRLSGHVQGDDDSIVRLSVVTNDDVVKTVKRFRFKKILATCHGVAQRISIKTTGRFPVEQDGTFKRAFGGGGFGIAKVEGTVSRDGSRVVGVFRANGIPIAGLGRCDVAPSGFAVHS